MPMFDSNCTIIALATTLILILCKSDVKFKFGFKTAGYSGTACYSSAHSYDYHTITLYWQSFLEGLKMAQCRIRPSSWNTLYTCDTSDYTECEIPDPCTSDYYAMAITLEDDGYADESCIQQLYIEKIDTATNDILDKTEIPIDGHKFDDSTYNDGQMYRLYKIDPMALTAEVDEKDESTQIATCTPRDPTAPICSPESNEYTFEFGFKTSAIDGGGGWTHIMTLYFGQEMLQCQVDPDDDDTIYTCGVKQYNRCISTETVPQYKLDISGGGATKATVAALYLKIFDKKGNVVKDTAFSVNNEKAGDIGYGAYDGRIWTINPESGNAMPTVSGQKYYTDPPLCKPLAAVEVKACDDFAYGSISNSLQMQLRGANGVSQFFHVNRRSVLPTNKESVLFTYNDINPSDIGSLYTAVLSVDDSDGYCIAGVTITLGDNVYEFNSAKYFGSGIILSNQCDYKYRFLSSDLPMISCIDGNLELNVHSPRSIFSLDIHTCVSDKSGISATSMKDNLYLSVMGKRNGHNRYVSALTKLDHYVPGDVSIQSLGHLIAGNAVIDRWHTNPISLYSSISGRIIGVRIESVDYYTRKIVAPDELSVTIGNNQLNIFSSQLFDDSRFLVAFFSDASRVDITPSSQIYVDGDIFNGSPFDEHFVNVYFIFDGDEYIEKYQLPFYIEESTSGINWFDANDECEEKYGTNLASIHSAEEEFLLEGYRGLPLSQSAGAWIGLFDLTVQEANNWRWTDFSYVDYTNWAVGKPDEKWLDSVRQDCGKIWAVDGWDDSVCSDTMNYYICANPLWFKNTNRNFEINVIEHMDEVIVISIGNNNKQDNVCIDGVSIKGESSLYISDYWIGGTHSSQLQAIFKYPVCSTEVVGVRIDYDSAMTNVVNDDSTISGLQCKNNNRMVSTTCTISQAYELTKVTSFSISNEDSKTDEFSWGTSFAKTTGHSDTTEETESTTTSNEFSWGFNEELTVGTEFAFASVELTVGANQQWTETEEETDETTTGHETFEENTNENFEENGESTTNTKSYESSYETSATTSIECSGEAEVPPGHSMEYNLIFNAFNTTIRTYTDLKLTLCSAFINDKIEDESNYIYIDNIPGVLQHKETTQCTVEFAAAKYIRNDIACDEEVKLAFATGSNYIPRCKDGDTKLYDGCQCDMGDSGTLGQCWCSDDTGNMIGDKLSYVQDGETEAEVCVQTLGCQDTKLQFSAPVVDLPDTHAIHFTLSYERLISSFVAGMSVVFIMVVVVVLFRKCRQKSVVYAKIEQMDSEFDEEDPLKIIK